MKVIRSYFLGRKEISFDEFKREVERIFEETKRAKEVLQVKVHYYPHEGIAEVFVDQLMKSPFGELPLLSHYWVFIDADIQQVVSFLESLLGAPKAREETPTSVLYFWKLYF